MNPRPRVSPFVLGMVVGAALVGALVLAKLAQYIESDLDHWRRWFDGLDTIVPASEKST